MPTCSQMLNSLTFICFLNPFYRNSTCQHTIHTFKMMAFMESKNCDDNKPPVFKRGTSIAMR